MAEGNFFILYKDRETFRGINRIFTRNVLEHTYSLTVLCSGIEGVDFDDYVGDRQKLYEENRKREAKINPHVPAQVLPFTWVDYANSLPLYAENQFVPKKELSGAVKISRESYRKYKKYDENKKKQENKYNYYDEKFLDHIVTEKGTDSWLAVIYIDGNNMGAKVQKIFDNEKDGNGKVSYEKAIRKLRKFAGDIQKDYIDERLKAIDDLPVKTLYSTFCRQIAQTICISVQSGYSFRQAH